MFIARQPGERQNRIDRMYRHICWLMCNLRSIESDPGRDGSRKGQGKLTFRLNRSD